MRRIRRIPLLLLILALLAVALSACAVVKPGTFAGGQPGGIGPVRLHALLCSIDTTPSEEAELCGPSEVEGGGQTEAQEMLAFAVPTGSSAPATLTVPSLDGGPTLVFTRNQEVADRIAEGLVEGEPGTEPTRWPP